MTTLLAALGSAGCGAGTYVWVDDLSEARSKSAADAAYVVASGDLVSIRVYEQDMISTRARVGLDGRISLPLVGEIDARGQRPAALAKQIEERLKPFIVSPSVAVTVEESLPGRISVVGEVAHPGVFPAASGAGVLHALALAGGLTEYADRDRIFVLRSRSEKSVLRIRLTYKSLTRGSGRGATFALEPGDTVVVE